MTGARVFPFFYRGDETRPMRIVVTPDNDVVIEQPYGHDALGVERWVTVSNGGDGNSSDARHWLVRSEVLS